METVTLVVWAPIKQGFIDSFGNVTYASRLRIVAEALNKLRKNVREFQLIEPFADPTKRILSLLDFRIGIVDRDIYGFGDGHETDQDDLRPREYMYLTATFDGPWEPYMRQIWQPMGVFLDLVLCNCEGYLPAQTTPFEDYANWVRDHLLDTALFYVVSDQSVKDIFYLKKTEALQREIPDPLERDVAVSTYHISTAEDEANHAAAQNPGETLKLALEALNVLYQLTRYYPPDVGLDGNGEFLLNATRVILGNIKLTEILEAKANMPLPDASSSSKEQMEKSGAQLILKQFRDQLAWYSHKYPVRPGTAPSYPDDPPSQDSEIQKGILSSYDDQKTGPVTHGALLLIQIRDAQKFRKFIHPSLWSWEGSKFPFFRNLSFTSHGLEKLSLSKKEFHAFPKEFREGMAVRAPMIGDLHHNHPQRWNLPERNAYQRQVAKIPSGRVSLDEIDAIVQLRACKAAADISESDDPFVKFELGTDEGTAPAKINSGEQTIDKETVQRIEETFQVDNGFAKLPKDVQKVLSGLDRFVQDREDTSEPLGVIDAYIKFLKAFSDHLGLELLSIQSTCRPDVTNAESCACPADPTTRDHFGFQDGISQPVIKDLDYTDEAQIKKSEPMAIKRGDLLLGYSNLLGDYHREEDDKMLQMNGSFLAIRKIHQDVGAFNSVIDKNSKATGLSAEFLAAKMMGRYKDGTPLVTGSGAKNNTFDYSNDPHGLECPFASHIRRANPREIIHKRKTPKILRRGMTYGTQYSQDKPEDKDRGILFMAYCANLAEQYEPIQNWVNGGNSTHIASAQFDPVMAAQPRDGKQVFRFAHHPGDNPHVDVVRFERDPSKPFVKLEWGTYAFVPAKAALYEIYRRLDTQDVPEGDLIDQIERGRKIIAEIDALPTVALRQRQWKILLEDYLTKDPDKHEVSPSVWEYIRSKHNGIYRIESGVEGRTPKESAQKVLLIADEEHIKEVLSSPEVFSVKEIGERLTAIFARHYIGMDPSDADYYKESADANEIIHQYTVEDAFNLTYAISSKLLHQQKMAAENLFGNDKFKIELTRDYLAQILARLCYEWFGLPEGEHFEAGGWTWDQTIGKDRKTACPGDFFAPSRGSFYPRPTSAIARFAHNSGARLLSAVTQLTEEWKKDGKVRGSLTSQMYKTQPDFELLGRNIIGAMIGMLPPTEANMRGILYDWIEEGTLWRVQGALAAETKGKPATYEQARDAILKPMVISMLKRPAPDLLHRLAVKDGKLDGVPYKKGDMIILSSVSATLSDLDSGSEKNEESMNVIFGGKRTGGRKNPGGNPHACPAKEMATGAMLAMLTALIESGRIQALPASLILEISEWN